MFNLCKIGIHDYEILERAFSDSNKFLSIMQAFNTKYANVNVHRKKVCLSKKVCLRCGKVVDEIEKRKKYLDAKKKKLEDREALAKKLYENSKEAPPAIFNRFEELCIDYCTHCIQRAKEHPVDIREDIFGDNMFKMFKHPIIAECYKKCNIESAEAKWFIDKCILSIKYRPWSQALYNTREFTIEEFKTFND